MSSRDGWSGRMRSLIVALWRYRYRGRFCISIYTLHRSPIIYRVFGIFVVQDSFVRRREQALQVERLAEFGDILGRPHVGRRPNQRRIIRY